jgi:organic radical activating enzyme
MRSSMNVMFFPTLRCQLNCAFCSSRAMPVINQDDELTADEWLSAFQLCPVTMADLAFSGGEPSLHGGLKELLLRLPAVNRNVSSNLVSHPKTWLDAETEPTLGFLGASLQFDPPHKRADVFWNRIVWVRENFPKLPVYVKYTVTQHTSPDAIATVRDNAVELGCCFQHQDYIDLWSFRHVIPRINMTALCTAGMECLTLLPNGDAYRCYGQALCGIDPIGNVRDGWGFLLSKPELCDECTCIPTAICGERRAVTLVLGDVQLRWAGLSGVCSTGYSVGNTVREFQRVFPEGWRSRFHLSR